jgi:hypothetical protein
MRQSFLVVIFILFMLLSGQCLASVDSDGVGRYQIIPTTVETILIDTKTGRTWLLSPSKNWEGIPYRPGDNGIPEDAFYPPWNKDEK